ncbi:putative monooxygenase fad-binding protein [Neofusicoccum parvum UCRNP2]|uniref:Putative monooxygenase fad-binding protein n=1 Tax=Botryosphaeria parva (strain UCR-NP2) TaxID=1287680 RepID=R1GA20_BOTPV|nr:putative monooxygenase fad-binding protein [Neofusicoccum parvum UCRNP2]
MPPTVLITGAGIAGPVLAFWLQRAGFTVTVVERSAVPRTTGQQIDVRGAALSIVGRMGLEGAVRARTVKEQGIAAVDGAGRRVAEFAARADGSGFTADVEILRGELAAVVYEATRERVEYVWGECVAGVEEVEDGVVHMAFFTIPFDEEKDTGWATWYNAPGGRLIFIRPDVERKRTGAYFGICGSDVPKDYLKLSVPEQQAMWEGLFKDAGGEAERVIKGMYAADDFYMQQIAQTKMAQWSKGRVVLLGDSAEELLQGMLILPSMISD